jgi:hypothetical protein
MGLRERRAQKDFEDKVLPGLKKQIDDAAGFAVPLEVDWPTLCVDEYSDSYESSWKKVYFEPLITALKAVAVDDMGKDALKAGLEKIVMTNRKGNYYGDYMPALESRVLTLDHQPNSNVDHVDERAKAIQKHLEDKL